MTTRQILPALAATLTLAALLLDLTPHADAKGKPGGGGNTNFAFVFEVPDDGLFLTTIDDGNRVRLTRTRGLVDHREPVWSPDLDFDPSNGYQGMIAYIEDVDGPDNLNVVNPDGSDNRVVRAGISTGINGVWAVWAPNAREVLLAEAYPTRIHAVEVATGNLRVLWAPEGSGEIRGMSISPLGQFAFDAAGDILVMDYWFNADGLIELDPATIELVTDPDTFEAAPSFSPDGTYLAYTHDEYSGNNLRIVVRDLLSGDEMVVMEQLNGWFRRVTWSPDGSQMATYNRVEGSRSFELIRIIDWADPAGRQYIPVTWTTARGAHERTPDWFPYWEDL